MEDQAKNHHVMIAIDWTGPFTLDEAREEANEFHVDGLYMCVGKCVYERNSRLQYMGISSNLKTRLTDKHHTLSLVTRERQIWLGEITTAEPSGKRIKVTKATLDYAEWLHVYFLQLPLNNKKKSRLPKQSVTVLNRWFTTDWYHRKKRPHKDWPDLIDYPDENLPRRMIWFGGKQEIIA